MLVRLSFVGLAASLSGCMLLQPPRSGTSPTGETVAPSGNGPSTSQGGPSSASGASDSGGSPSRGAEKPAESPIISVSVDFRNECSEKVEYCVDSGGSTLNTSLGGNTSTSSTFRPGTKIQLKKDNKCNMTIFTVPESRDRQKVVLCQK